MVHNGAWIWSTRAAGAGAEDIERTYTSYKTCTVCVRRLEKDGVIKKYVAVLDMEKINYGFVVFCNVKLKHINHQIASDFVAAVNSLPSFAILTLQGNLAASLTKIPAGRAWIPWGSVIV